MNTIDSLTQFFGWCAVVNMALLMLSSIIIVAYCAPISKIHAAMFKLSEEEVKSAYFTYLGHFKIAVIVFSLVPYLALKLMAS